MSDRNNRNYRSSNEDRGNGWRRSRSRSRSPSPPPPTASSRRANLNINHNSKLKAEQEEERKARMMRLRLENEEEERRLAAAATPKDQHDDKQYNSSNRDARAKNEILQVQPEELEGLEEEDQMKLLLGFSGFGTTSGQKVEDNQNSAARGAAAKNKARKYRQYMNRKGGFNKPLDKMD